MSGAESTSRQQLEYVTRNFPDLQGLKMLPLAGVFAAWGASEAHLLTGTTWWFTFGTSVVVAAVGMPLIARWYRHRFGTVEPIRDSKRSVKIAVIAVALLVAGIGTMMLGTAGLLPRVEVVGLPGIVLGIALALFGIAQGSIARREHPWMWRYGLTVATLSALPMGLWTTSGVHPINASGVMAFVIAGYIAIASIDTHVALTRMLVRSAEQGGVQ